MVPHWIKAGVPILGLFAVNEAIFNGQNDALGEWPHNWLVGPELNMFSWAFGNGTGWFGQTFKWVAAAADKAVAGTSLPRPLLVLHPREGAASPTRGCCSTRSRRRA